MNLSDRIVATIRTVVPALVGMILAALIAKIPLIATVISWIDANLSDVTGGVPVAQLLGLIATAGVVAAYYWTVRKLADRWPLAERLLGSSKTPVYSPAKE